MQSVAIIPHIIIQQRHSLCCFYPASNIMGRRLLCQILLCRIRRRRKQIHHCHSIKWDTIDNLPTNVPDLVLPHLYRLCHHRTSYMLLFSSIISPIIPHIFCCAHHFASLSHIFCRCLDFPQSLLSYPLPSLSIIPVISHVWLHFPYQPVSPLLFSYYTVSSIPHLYLRHPYCPTYLPHLCCSCLHNPAFLLMTSPSFHISASDVYIVPCLYF